jgi:hypothetical protein
MPVGRWQARDLAKPRGLRPDTDRRGHHLRPHRDDATLVLGLCGCVAAHDGHCLPYETPPPISERVLPFGRHGSGVVRGLPLDEQIAGRSRSWRGLFRSPISYGQAIYAVRGTENTVPGRPFGDHAKAAACAAARSGWRNSATSPPAGAAAKGSRRLQSRARSNRTRDLERGLIDGSVVEDLA